MSAFLNERVANLSAMAAAAVTARQQHIQPDPQAREEPDNPRSVLGQFLRLSEEDQF
jgi:hypothetical protein